MDNNSLKSESDEKPITLDHLDPYFYELRHKFLGDAGEAIQKFIDENPAAAAHYGAANQATTSDLRDQIYSLNDASKIVDHRTLFFALVSVYEKKSLEIVADLEQVLVHVLTLRG
jgi:hypothetical protein